MRGYVDRIRGLGAELVVVGSGSVVAARAFRDEQQINFPLYTDPSLKSYRAAGLKRGLATVLNARSAVHAIGAVFGGFGQSRTQGDGIQQGGAFVIDTGGHERFSYVSREAGDHPDPEKFLLALA